MAKPVIDARLKHEADGFTEVAERGKGWLKSRKPGTNQYALSTQVGNFGWHRGAGPFTALDEIDTDWQPTTGTWDYEMTRADYQAYIDTAGNYRYEDYLTGEYVNLNVTFFGWTNAEGASQQIPFDQVTPSVSGDVLTWAELFGTGTELRIQTQTARLAKFLDVANLTDLPAPTIGGTNIQLTFSYQMIRSSDLDVYVDGAKWNDNSTITTATNVEFRQKSTGNPVWWFRTPIANDANGEQVEGSQTLKKAGVNLFVDGHIPYSWISSATFPITIDPTIDPQVGASTDDGQELSGGVPGLTAAALVLDNDTYTGGLRFAAVDIDNGSTIDVAYLSIYSTVTWADDPYFDIYAIDEDNPSTFTISDGDIDNRTLTTASATEGPTTGVGVGWYNCQSMTTVVKEVVDRPGWSNNQAMSFILPCLGTGTTNRVRPSSYDGNSSLAEILHIEYTAGGSPSASPSISPSASVSPSSSESASISPSASVSPSVSPSASVSPSISPSASLSPSASESASISPSASESASVSPSLSTISGEVTWGHDTGVLEANIRDFAGNWTGTGSIVSSGDDERICLDAGQSMESEIVFTDTYFVTLLQNNYDPSGDNAVLEYRHAATEGGVSAASYSTYTVPFASLGYVQIRLSRPL